MAQRAVGKASDGLAATFERLSSGQRINRASDDAAGLAVSSQLQLQSRIYSRGILNVNDAVSAMTIAQGALEALEEITYRHFELAEQAANGTLSVVQRRTIQREADQLTQEYNRVIATTSFNGVGLIDRSLSDFRVQAGVGAEAGVALSVGDKLARNVGQSTFSGPTDFIAANANSITTADFNRDGKGDIVAVQGNGANVRVLLGNGDGTLLAGVQYATGGSNTIDVTIGDFNGDGIIDLGTTSSTAGVVSALLGRGDGTFQAAVSFAIGTTVATEIRSADVNNDGYGDLVYTENGTGNIGIMLSNGNGTFRAPLSHIVSTTNNTVSLADVNGDGRMDLITAGGAATFNVSLGNGDGTFRSAASYALNNSTTTTTFAIADFNRDGYLDIAANGGAASALSVVLGNGDGTFAAFRTQQTGGTPTKLTYSDFNGDGYYDIGYIIAADSTANILLGNGDGTFTSRISTSVTGPSDLAVCDLNSDGVSDLIAGSNGSNVISVALQNTTRSTRVGYLNLLTQMDARQELPNLQSTLNRITGEIGVIGSHLSRLESMSKTLMVARENYLSAASRIMDADIAQESSQLTMGQILQSTGTAVLSQANLQPSLALTLLKG